MEKESVASGKERGYTASSREETRGFEGGYGLTNAETGKGYIIGLWESREDAEGFESSAAFREQAAKFEDILDGPPSREVCEVNIQV